MEQFILGMVSSREPIAGVLPSTNRMTDKVPTGASGPARSGFV